MHTQEEITTESSLPSSARVVIAGGGLIGNSVAYHLVQNGWSDIVIIDKGKIADGTSKYGSGVLGLFRPQHERRLVQYCIELYQKLQNQGYDIGLKQCGSINLANTKDRMLSLQRRANRYKPTGLDCHVLLKEELNKLHPFLYTDDLQGGVWVPSDATVHPKRVSEVLAYLSQQGGARFVDDCGVNRVLTVTPNALGPNSSRNNRVKGVLTEKGCIACEYFVNCAGIWAREIGKLSDPSVKIPICPSDHFFLMFKEIPELIEAQSLPTVRDYDNYIYLRRWQNSFMMGCFEPRARPFDIHKQGNDWNAIREEHWIHMSPYIAAATNRMPILKQTQYNFLQNTPDAFTPDGKWILGESSEVSNYYVCAGMNGNSLQGAGGVGKVVADLIVNRQPIGNMLHFELQRFTSLHNNPRFLLERTAEVVGRHYQLEYPLINEFRYGRKIRTSPIYSELQSRGAVFGERMGWERPLFFDPYHSRDDPAAPLPKGTFGKPEFLDYIEEEYSVCREAVGLIDMSSFTKLIIRGEQKSVVNYLQLLCANDVDIPIGGIIAAGMLNEHGCYENDCLLIRKSGNSYFMVSPTQQQTRILEWMENHLPDDNSIALHDVTSMYTVLSVAGPKSRDLMQEMTNSDMNMQPFTFKEVNIGYASGVMVLAVTQTGEPGYSLYIPSEYALHLYNTIMTTGKDYGIRNVGHLAMRFLRIEKFIPFWGEELTSETTPFEVGKGFRLKFEKHNFIGYSALHQQKIKGVTKKLVQFQLIDFDKDTHLWPWGGEAVYRNGEYVGVLTNSAYGFTLKKMISLGFVEHPETIKGNSTILSLAWLSDRSAEWMVNIAGKMVPVRVNVHPPTIPAVNHATQREYKPKKPKPGHAPAVDLFKNSEISQKNQDFT